MYGVWILVYWSDWMRSVCACDISSGDSDSNSRSKIVILSLIMHTHTSLTSKEDREVWLLYLKH